MKQGISGLELHYMVEELQQLCGGKIDKIYQPEAEELLFQIHIPNKGKHYLRFVKGMFLYLTKSKRENPHEPPPFCVYLRKRIQQARIKEISQLDLERVVRVVLETREQHYHLYLELFSKGNAILCDHEDTILMPMEVQKWKERIIKQREAYRIPKQEHDLLTLTKEELEVLLTRADRSVVKILATNLGLGGTFAEEACCLANVEKSKTTLSGEERNSLFHALQALLKNKKSATVVLDGKEIIDVVPFPLMLYQGKEQKPVPSFSEALHQLLLQSMTVVRREKHYKAVEEKTSKYDVIIKKQSQQVQALKIGVAENQRKGELLYEHYQEIQLLLERITILRKQHSWEEVKKRIQGAFHGLVQNIDERHGTVTIKL